MEIATVLPGSIGVEIGGEGKTYFDHVVTDNIIDALIELSAEVWTTRDRLMVLEQVLAEKGIDATTLVEAHVPSNEQAAARKEAREAFVAQIFNSFLRRAK